MTAGRRSRLAVRACPGCAQDTLVSNGAFWICAGCQYAATSMALAMDQGATDLSLRSPTRSHRRAHTYVSFAEAGLEAEPAYTTR